MELHTASHSRQRGHRRQRLARGTALLVSTALLVAACDDGGDRGDETSSTTGGSTTVTEGASRVFRLRLSEGTSERVASNAAVVDGEPLDPERVAEIVTRLPEWLRGSAAQTEFNWPTQTTPP